MAQESALKVLCVPENYIRCTPYSDVYRGLVTLEGRRALYDIEHIRLPLNKARTDELIARYNLTPGEVNECNLILASCVKRSIKFLHRLRQDQSYAGGDANNTAGKNSMMSVPNYEYIDIVRRDDGGSDVYLMTRPMDRWLSSRACEGGMVQLDVLLTFFRRLILVLTKLERAHAYLGVFDLDSVCLLSPGPGETADQELIVFTSFLYAQYDDDASVVRYPKFIPFNAHESLLRGGKPNTKTDTYSIAYLLLSILNGTYGTPAPDNRRPPDYIPAEISNALYSAMSGEIDLKQLMKVLRDTVRTAGASIQFNIPIYTTQPCYINLPKPEPEAEPYRAFEPEVLDEDMDFSFDDDEEEDDFEVEDDDDDMFIIEEDDDDDDDFFIIEED